MGGDTLTQGVTLRWVTPPNNSLLIMNFTNPTVDYCHYYILMTRHRKLYINPKFVAISYHWYLLMFYEGLLYVHLKLFEDGSNSFKTL
jgi:hypothetical protein